MALQKNDFIEIEFTGKVKNGEIFDSTIKEDLEKLHHGHGHEIVAKPFVFCLGQGMFLKAIDDFLIGKTETGTYEIELKPEEAFGERSQKLVQMISLKVFKEHRINPVPGIVFNFDGRPGKIITVSGGRIIVDFNHALAGKPVVYKINVLKKITDIDEKVKALNDFFFRKDFPFKIEGKILVLEVEKNLKNLVELFKDKFREMLDLELKVEVREVGEESETAQDNLTKPQ